MPGPAHWWMTVPGADAPFALALVAGAVAAFNPCGFALLPAYLALLVSGNDTAEPSPTPGAQVVRALRLAAAMTAGFAAVFGAFGLLVAYLSLSIERYLPIVTLLIGVGLVGLGGWLLSGRHVPGVRLFGGVGRAPARGLGSQLLYGVAFASASLTCTIAPFLALTATAARVDSILGVTLVFLTYAVGMGAVVAVLAIAVALARVSLVVRLRRAAPRISRLSGVVVAVAGAYVTWYAWFELRIQAGQRSGDVVIDTAIRLQSQLARFVAGLGPVVIGSIAVSVAVGALLLTFVEHSRKARQS